MVGVSAEGGRGRRIYVIGIFLGEMMSENLSEVLKMLFSFL